MSGAASPTTVANASSPDIPSSPNGVRRDVIIGVSVSAISLVVCLLLSALLLRRQRRKRREEVDSNRLKSSSSTKFKHHEPPRQSVHEIGQNSMVGPIRELANTGKVELRTQRSSAEHRIQPARRATTVTIFETSRVVSSHIDDYIHEGNMMSASAYQSIFDISPATSSPVTDRHSWKAHDLDRPLPPTPISEIPMPSPAIPRPIEIPSLYRWLEGFFPNRTITSQFLQELGLHNHRLSDFAQQGGEIVIPPGRSDPKWVWVPNLSEERVERFSWI